MLPENVISHNVIGLAMNIHSTLGPGLLESAYRECLFYDIRESGLLMNFNSPSLKDGIRRMVNGL